MSGGAANSKRPAGGGYGLPFDHALNRILLPATTLDTAVWIVPRQISGRGGDLQEAMVTLKFHRFGDA